MRTMTVLFLFALLSGVFLFLAGGHLYVEEWAVSMWACFGSTGERELTVEEGVSVLFGTLGAMAIASLVVLRTMLKLSDKWAM